jgi:hypothetical protein
MVAEVIAGPNMGLLLIPLLSLVVPLMAIIHAANQSAVAFYAAGSNKTAWIVVLVVSTLLGLGLLLGAWYLLVVRAKLQRQASSVH